MSVEALNWALRQNTARPAWQGMLFVIANAADPDGIAFAWWKHDNHWWPYLSRHSGLRRASVFRVLNEMEEAGLFTRDLISPKTAGRPQPVIRLNFERFYDIDGADKPPDESYGETGAESHGETGGGEPSPTMGPDQSHHGTALSSNPNTNPNPPTPPSGGSDPSEDSNEEEKTAFLEVIRPYPRPTTRGTVAFARWHQWTAAERTVFVKAIAGMVATHKANPKIAVPDVEKFMRDSLTLAAYAEKAPPPPNAGPALRFLPVNSDELRALAVLVRIVGSEWAEPVFDAEQQEHGKRVKTPPLPPPALGAARFANGIGEIDTDAWLTLERGPQRRQIGAWREALHAWLGWEIGARERLLVPCEWPSGLKPPV